MDASRELVLARLHLGAILPLLEDIVRFDETARRIVDDWNVTLQFRLAGKKTTALIFRNGILAAAIAPDGERKPLSVNLTFHDPRHVNAFFKGQRHNSPRPGLCALLHLSELKEVPALLSRLDTYMHPSAEMLKDPSVFRFCVMIKLYALAFGIRQVGEYDPDMEPVTPRLPEGTIEFRVESGPVAHLGVGYRCFRPGRGPAARPSAVLEIKDNLTAWRMLHGGLDVPAAIGAGDIRLHGYIPLLYGISPIVDRLALYLANGSREG